MRTISLSEDVDFGIEDVWPVIGDFGGIKKWAPIVESETIEETPEGLVRVLIIKGGREVRELLVDQGPAHYTYSLDRADMDHYHSTIMVRPTGSGGTTIAFSITFQPKDGVDMGEATTGFLKFFEGNLKAMKRAIAAD